MTSRCPASSSRSTSRLAPPPTSTTLACWSTTWPIRARRSPGCLVPRHVRVADGRVPVVPVLRGAQFGLRCRVGHTAAARRLRLVDGCLLGRRLLAGQESAAELGLGRRRGVEGRLQTVLRLAVRGEVTPGQRDLAILVGALRLRDRDGQVGGRIAGRLLGRGRRGRRLDGVAVLVEGAVVVELWSAVASGLVPNTLPLRDVKGVLERDVLPVADEHLAQQREATRRSLPGCRPARRRAGRR